MDPAEALSVAADFLNSDPVAFNVILGILNDRIAHPAPGRYWWVERNGAVVAVAMQSPIDFLAGVAASSPEAALALGTELAAAEPVIPGANGEASVVSRVAGAFASVRKIPAVPVEAQRLYRLGTLIPPAGVAGTLAQATPDDADLVIGWMHDFHEEVEGGIVFDADMIRRRVAEGRFWLWQDGESVSMAAVPSAVAGVARIGAVYTPPERRRHGYAAAVVAGLSARCLAAGNRHCVLYTQLSNPTSNAVYQRIGFEPVLEALRYRFGD